MRRSSLLGTMLLLAIACGAPQAPPSLIRGFAPQSSGVQSEIESRYREGISADRIREHLRWLSSRLHTAGTPGTEATVEYVRDALQESGWQAEIVRYDAWLPLPKSTSIELLEPVAQIIPTTEERIEGDPFTESVAEHPGWNGYSASGDVTAPVVYGHFGSDDDFRALLERGIDPTGKIVLLRYFSTGDGHKVANAERFGAAGVILYADPAEDGFAMGPVYPEGNWRPPGSIMRRSIEFTPYSGDPLSPGWASVPGADRLAPEQARLPRIPVVPTSYTGAQTLLEQMGGAEAPADWQGALPVPYRFGGEATVHLVADMDNADRPMLNVVATLTGAAYPDQWIVLGNHHDAWIYGAGDPSSGTAAGLEMARVLGELAAAGHRPARTLVLGIWDAEEMLLGGSTEWVEDHAEELLQKAVANINMDSAVFNVGRPLRVHGHAALHDLFREVAATLTDPNSGRNFAEVWTDDQNAAFKLPSVDGFGLFLDRSQTLRRPWIFETPSDDASPFFDYLALPATDMYYGGDYGMYHSIYENFHWMSTVVDPTFGYHALMGQLHGLVALRLANADLLPLEYATEASFWRLAFEDLAATAAARNQQVPRLDEALALIDAWEDEAEGLADDLADLSREGDLAALDLGSVNREIYLLARDFYRPEGTPARPWNKNLFDGSPYDFEGASGSTLPGLRFALDEGQAEIAATESDVYIGALSRRVENLRSLRSRLR